MAKRKAQEPTGPGTAMILVLVFFVLATLILGVTTYLGFDGQSELQKQAKDAQDKEKAAKTNADDFATRLNVNRIAVGTDTPQNREELSGSIRANAAAAQDERKLLVDKLGPAAFPTRNAFDWKLIEEADKGADGGAKLSPAPNKTIPQIAKEWAKLYADMKTKYDNEVAAHKKTQDQKIAADKRADDQKEAFDKQVANLSDQIKKKIGEMDTAFLALKTEADKKGLDFKKTMDQWAEEKARLEESVRLVKQEREVSESKYRRAISGDQSDLLARLEKFDPAKVAEKMGTVSSRDTAGFLTVTFQNRIHLVPGQSFVVLSPQGSLVEVIEKEKELEKQHHGKSLDAREPFLDNDRIKGMIEITEVIGAGTARARITSEPLQIRNPIAKGDQLFNMALSSGEAEHVAYAGIIDLDGDGRPDNEAFVRILEKNNLKVDAFLDLKSGEIKGRIDYKTKLLIIGSDAPLVGGVKTMIAQAQEKNVKTVDARMFLALIGVKPPKNPAPPAYNTVTLGGEGSKNVDPEAPMPPPAAKDEGKKDEPKKDK